MDPFEYIVVLTSLILGLGIAQILRGIADVVAHWKQVRFSAAQMIYAVVVFIIHIQDWWINYEYSMIPRTWTLFDVLIVLIFPILLFIQARMLFPTGSRSNETDMVLYWDDQWKWLYGIGISYVLVSIWHNIHFSQLPLIDSILQILYVVVFLTFIIGNIRKHTYHTIFAIAQLIAWIILIAADDMVININ